VKRAALYVVAIAAAILASAWLLGLIFAAADAHRAIRTSAVIAFVVQLVTWAILRVAGEEKMFAGRVIGMLLRLATLVVYGLAFLKPYGLDPTSALVSLATFFFLSTLVESVLVQS
jgi:hypothetical protein